MPDPVDGSHAPFAELLDDLVRASDDREHRDETSADPLRPARVAFPDAAFRARRCLLEGARDPESRSG